MTLLTPEEQFIWNCAWQWRDPAPDILAGPQDWPRVAQIGRINRMETLLRDLLIHLDVWGKLPAKAQTILQEGADKYARNAAIMGDSLHTYLHMAAERGIDTAVLKGLSISINLYGNPAMRPGGDIDVLVREKDVTASLDILEEMGIGQNWPNLMHDDYYTRHHLHQQRCTEDLTLWYEIHWALDHPLTRLTIDYEGMMDRATPGTLLNAPVCDLAWEDNLIALSVHLAKHAVYLTAVLDRPDLPRILLADGMLMYFLDVDELVNLHGTNLDWPQLVARCRAFGTAEMVGAVLQVCARYLDTAVPDSVLAELPVTPPGHLKRHVMRRVAEYKTAAYLGQRQSRLWHFLLVTNGAFILRPIRLLDLSEYLFPGRNFLRRKYGDDSRSTAVKHTFRALGQYGRVAKDTAYFTWERYRRLRRQDYSTSLFNRLEVEA
ncbi:MAG: nucleotidyltransferase family protein [Chloroflexi bacterium]|nr:nucleotidyltransferase family protein [Chloroflexota bacterium]